MHIVLFFSGFLPKGLQGLACQLLNCLFAANTRGINYSFIKILLSLFFTALGLKPTTLHMACTKQTARKNTGGKPVAMGKGKDPVPKQKPKPGRADHKVIIEYSSDKFDEENPQPVEGTGAPKRVVRQIHLTLPTSPMHVTTTESFKTFFINHGLTKALRKAFENQGWSTDQMQELMTNFKNRYGQTIPLPKIYQDEDSSDDEGLALGDGTRYGKKTTGGGRSKGGGGKGSGGRGGGCMGGNGSTDPKPGPSWGRGGDDGGSVGGGGGGTGGRQLGKRGRDDNDDDDPNKRRKMGDDGRPPRQTVAHKEPCRTGTAYPPVNQLDSSTEENDTRGKDAGEVGETPQIQSGDSGS